MAYLKIIAGPSAGQICELGADKSVLGRHSDCDVSMVAAGVSRHHAQIVLVGDDYFLEDLHSRNGTFLNDQQVHGKRRIHEGDLVRISDSVFAFHRGRALDSRQRETLSGGRLGAVLVDDEDQASQMVLVSERDASSNEGTSRSKSNLQVQLRALLEITRNLHKTLALDKVLPRILDSLFVIFPPADRGFIVLRDEDGEIRPRWVKLRHEDAGPRPHISRTIVNRVMESRQAILSADAASDSRFDGSQSVTVAPIRSMMCVPLIDSEGNSFGVLQIDTVSVGDRFQDADLEVLLNVATQASVAIDNARLYEYNLRQQAIERDLELADQIQQGFLPKHPPQLPGYQFFDYYRPTNRVGGDFYDYVPLSDGRLAVVVADIVGHGLAAAMLTAKLAAEVRFGLLSAHAPEEAVTRLNASLSRDLLEDHFVTLVLAVLAPDTGEVTIVNAGHMPPILRRADGRAGNVGTDQAELPLGLVSGIEYRPCTVRLPSAGLLVIYTDGINEATNDSGQRYGVDHILQHIDGAIDRPEQLGRAIIGDLQRFTSGYPQEDDMCLLCFGRE